MWSNFNPTIYEPDAYRRYAEGLPDSSLTWIKFIVLHNTGAPSLAQWHDGGATVKQRLTNLEHFYEVTQHWHAGPHAFIDDEHICGFSNILAPGVHASCFNSKSLGFEMVGDFSTESFTSGPGAKVRDNAVYALAVWHRKLHLRPDGYVYGTRGLHFHKDCMRDRHDCPGKHVDRADVVQRVLAEMARQDMGPDVRLAGGGGSGGSDTVVSHTTATSNIPDPKSGTLVTPTHPLLVRGSQGKDVERAQRLLNTFRKKGATKIKVDGDFAQETTEAVRAFQHDQNLDVDGKIGPETWAALERDS